MEKLCNRRLLQQDMRNLTNGVSKLITQSQRQLFPTHYSTCFCPKNFKTRDRILHVLSVCYITLNFTSFLISLSLAYVSESCMGNEFVFSLESPLLTRSLCLCVCTEGCPGLCNGNGRCTLGNSGWYCVCQLGWRGTGCDTSMETSCSDAKDNDGGKQIQVCNSQLASLIFFFIAQFIHLRHVNLLKQKRF